MFPYFECVMNLLYYDSINKFTLIKNNNGISAMSKKYTRKM